MEWGYEQLENLPAVGLAMIGGVITVIAVGSLVRADATAISRGLSTITVGCGIALIAGAEWLRHIDRTARQTLRVLIWCVIGLVAAMLLGVFVLLHQYSVGASLAQPELDIFRMAAVGAVGGAIIGGFDALRLHQQHEASRTQEALEELVTAAPAPIIALDTEGRVELWNDAAENLFGYPAEDVIGDPYPLVPPDKDAEFENHLDRILSSESLRSVETTRQGKDGSMVTVRIYARPLHDPTGDVHGVIAILVDITDQKRRQEQLSVLNRVLRHNFRNDLTVIIGSADELIGRLDRLEQTLNDHLSEQTTAPEATKTALDASDENQDLSDVAAALGEAMALSTSPSSKQLATNIRKTAVELADIGEKARSIEAMLQEETARSRSRPIGPLVASAIREIESEYPAVEVVTETDSLDGVSVVGPAQLAQALYELLENAVVHHDGDTPSVTVSASTSESKVRLRVIDDGPGIPGQEQEVLEKGSESALTHGSGLGLWFVNWCMSLANGTMSIAESTAGGAVVELAIPRASHQPTERPNPPEGPSVQQWAESNLS